MSDSIKHTMLENIVNGISDLLTVKTRAAQFRAQMGTKLIYEQYYTLIVYAAQAYDAQHAIKVNSRGTRRSVYNSEIYNHNPTEYTIYDSYNVDNSIFQLNINNVNTDYNSELYINNTNTEYNPENGQTDQLAIFISVLA